MTDYAPREVLIYRLGRDSTGPHWNLVKAVGDGDGEKLTITRLARWCEQSGQPPGQYKAEGWRNTVQLAWGGVERVA